MNFQEIILKLHEYWAKQKCIIQQPCDIEVGAGTFNPATFLRVLGPEPWRVAYVEPSRRPTDGRYGDNPSRTGHYYQYQVILKPSPPDIQNIYLKSLEYIGIDLNQHDVRFVEDDWESPTLGASGLGWEIWLDGLEVTQYTYFQQMGSVELDPMSVEITYGLERIALDLQDVDSIFDIEWTNGIAYGDIHHRGEVEYSTYYLEEADTAMLFSLFDTYEKEALACFKKGLILPAVDYVLKCSHTFNVLDARKSISVTERVSYIARVRNLARRCAQGYSEQREEMGYPLLGTGYSMLDTGGSMLDARPAPKSQYSDLLLEIGTEEIPASYIQPALKQMENRISKLLKDSRLDFKSVRTMGTPRRLALSVEEVSTGQPDRTVEAMGPPKKAAFDAEGNPTKAAEGFARRFGGTVGDLKIKETDRGEYVYLLKQELGKSTIELLSEELSEFVASLNFPKSMHFSSFEDGKLQFARPIRWVVALLGEDVINFSVGRVQSDRLTYGHRFLSGGSITLENASLDNYKESLRKADVIVDHEERKNLIKDEVTHILESEGCSVHIDEELLNTVTFLVEMPRAIVGTFSESYLSLPVEVLETAMKKHQRYFSLRTETASGATDVSPLLPKFITITNGVGDEGIVRHGNERVLRARLADAEFFYKEDQKLRISDEVEKLKHVVFQVELGSLYDKAQRMKGLTAFICGKLGLDEISRNNAIRASELCKVDLITQMVIEFPSLQGIMGGYYAASSGESDEVAAAVRYHYYPTSPDGELPGSIVGSVVSIADKIDTIVGYFGIGKIPSGSQDPYALRRQAAGIVRILFESELSLRLDAVVEKAVSLYNRFPEPDAVSSGVLEFLKGRISSLLSEQGFAYDIVDSVLALDSVDVSSTVKRADALSRFRKRSDFEGIYNAFNRVIRILPKEAKGAPCAADIVEGLLKDQSERDLYKSIVQIEAEVEQVVAEGKYDVVLEQLAGLRTIIDTFFDEVLVMADEDDLRNNRLLLLQFLASKFSLVADFSKLVE